MYLSLNSLLLGCRYILDSSSILDGSSVFGSFPNSLLFNNRSVLDGMALDGILVFDCSLVLYSSSVLDYSLVFE